MSIVNVFAVDITPGGYPTGTTYVPNRLDTVLVSVDDSTMDASFIAANILATTQQRAGAHSTIRQLHLCSHGNSGTLLMGKGIDVSNVSGFGILAGHFSPVGPLSASILIHGCAVASSTTIDDGCFETNSTGRRIPRSVCTPGMGTALGTPSGWETLDQNIASRIRRGPGYLFLAALARATRVTVKAAFQAQDADRVGLNNWNLEGATMTVRPSGSGWIVDPFENVGISNSAGYYQF